MKNPVFVSYAREDADFALRLAADLKAKGANVWLDQLDIRPGRQWDREVERALTMCNEMIVVLSPAALDSNNVMDEVAFALEERKAVIPVLQAECRLPFRLRRLQYIDLKSGYEHGLQTLLATLAQEDQISSGAVATDAGPATVESRNQHGSTEDRIDREKAEPARQAEQDRIDREKTEAARKAEQDRIDREKTEAVRKAEQDRIAREKTEAARKAEQEKEWKAITRKWANEERDKAPKQLALMVFVLIALALIIVIAMKR